MVAAGLLAWLFTLAQEPVGEPPLGYLLQFGVVGLGLIALIMGWIVPRYVLHQQAADFARLLAEKDARLERAYATQAKVEGQLEELIAAYEQRVLPTMTEFASTADRLGATMQTLVSLLQQPDRAPQTRRRDGW